MTKNQTMAVLAIIILAASLTGIGIAVNNFMHKLHNIEVDKSIDDTIRDNEKYLAENP